MNQIKLITDQEEINELYNFIKRYPLNYPNYEEWLRKCKRELELGYKKAFIYFIGGRIVADLIFQPKKDDFLVLEIKNMRVEERHRKKGIFGLLINNVEEYAIQKEFKRIIVDTHNEDVIIVLTKLGFKIESRENLYLANRKEIILAKDLNGLESKLV